MAAQVMCRHGRFMVMAAMEARVAHTKAMGAGEEVPEFTVAAALVDIPVMGVMAATLLVSLTMLSTRLPEQVAEAEVEAQVALIQLTTLLQEAVALAFMGRARAVLLELVLLMAASRTSGAAVAVAVAMASQHPAHLPAQVGAAVYMEAAVAVARTTDLAHSPQAVAVVMARSA